jgi:hypothetical protein
VVAVGGPGREMNEVLRSYSARTPACTPESHDGTHTTVLIFPFEVRHLLSHVIYSTGGVYGAAVQLFSVYVAICDISE